VQEIITFANNIGKVEKLLKLLKRELSYGNKYEHLGIFIMSVEHRFCHRVFSNFLARYAWWQGVRRRFPHPRPLRYPASAYGGGAPWHFRGELSDAHNPFRRFRIIYQIYIM